MLRLTRTWLGSFLVGLGYRTLPQSVRDEWDLQFQRKTVEVPHAFDLKP